jgi:hypothetical protein
MKRDAEDNHEHDQAEKASTEHVEISSRGAAAQVPEKMGGKGLHGEQ